jgi:hypothetical protein
MLWVSGHTVYSTGVQLVIQTLRYYRDIKNRLLRAVVVNSAWYISNKVIHTDLKVPTVTEEITKFGNKYREKIKTSR